LGRKVGIRNLICITGLLLTFIFWGAFIHGLGAGNRSKMEGKIYLVPVGNIESWVLETLKKGIGETFSSKVEIYEKMKFPQRAFNAERNQYFCPHIMNSLRDFIDPGKKDKVLGIVVEDLYIHGLNFVFGQAELGGHFALISLARLHQSFYGLAENKIIFLERTKKEAVHELGHTFGLEHCPDPECVMHFSNSLMDTDRKSASFCSRCKELLIKRIKTTD